MNTNLLALSGKMTSGKSTIAKYLSENYGYTIMSIGSNIKSVAQYLIEDTDKLNEFFFDFFRTKESEKIINKLRYLYKNQFANELFQKNIDGTFLKNQSYRDLSQEVATLLRNDYGEDIWVNILSEQAHILANQGKAIVIDDLRLKNEKLILSNHGYKFIRLHVSPEVQRERLLNLYGEINNELLNHITEVDLDNDSFDFTIDTSVISLDECVGRLTNILELNKERCNK